METVNFILLLLVAVSAFAGIGRTESCRDRCDDRVDSSKECQCNEACLRYNDCCTDYAELCQGSGSGEVTLASLADILWEADADRASLNDVQYSLQGRTTSSSSNDVAPDPLFAYVNPDLLRHSVYSGFIRLLNNYNSNTGQTEHLSELEWAETDAFLETIAATGPMVKAVEYLCAKGHLPCNDKVAVLEKLRELWFDLYPRSGRSGAVVDSSGFEHVFVGERKSTSVTGFHSWVQFYLEERNGDLDYKGYIALKEPAVLNTRLTWYGKTKKQASFFVRSSPAFDMAIYTVCFMVKPGQACPITVQGQQLTIQTYDVRHKAGRQVATAFVAV